jgi:hypothetical protein
VTVSQLPAGVQSAALVCTLKPSSSLLNRTKNTLVTSLMIGVAGGPAVAGVQADAIPEMVQAVDGAVGAGASKAVAQPSTPQSSLAVAPMTTGVPVSTLAYGSQLAIAATVSAARIPLLSVFMFVDPPMARAA